MEKTIMSTLKFLHQMHSPVISIYCQTGSETVTLYFFRGIPGGKPDPETAMAVVTVSSEDNLLVAKLFNDEDAATPDTSEIYTLVREVEVQS